MGDPTGPTGDGFQAGDGGRSLQQGEALVPDQKGLEEL